MDPTPAAPPPATRAKGGAAKFIIAGLMLVVLLAAIPGISSYRSHLRLTTGKKVVQGNLRQLGAALDQFTLEKPHRLFLRFEDIYGPQNYIKGVFPSPLGEDYQTLFPFFLPDNEYGPSIRIPQGLLISQIYAPTPPPPPDGAHTQPYRYGGKFEFTWRGGVRHGPMRAWRDDGSLWCEAVFEEGRAISAIHVTHDGRRFDELKGEVPP